MSTNSPDTWPRDGKVLQSVAKLLDEKLRPPGHDEIVADTNLSADDVSRSLIRLNHGRMIDVTIGSDGGQLPRPEWVNSISREGLERAKAWPSAETAADRIIAQLEHVEVHSDDEDTRTRARKILDAVADGGRDILVGVAAAAITGQLPS